MENLTPAASQENVPTRTAVSIDGENTASSPVLPLLGSQHGSKPRKAPTITPRTFTRFFTPKSSLERGGRIGASRKALRDITASASNRGGRRTPTKDTIQIFDEDLSGTTGISKKKRKILDSVDVTPDRSSPLKRIRNQSLETSEEGDGSDAKTSESGEEVEDVLKRDYRQHRRILKAVDPIVGSRYRGGFGRDLRREIGAFGKITKARSLNQGFGESKDWQHETTDFFTRPEDAHLCKNPAVPADLSIPFCTATCNTNSLVAVGDEDGGVRLLESSKDEKPGFPNAYLTFRPHANAILDLGFSPDDLLLATASGDQTSQVIDMRTQRATYTLSGHGSSVKQVCFQPGSSSVLATSSRDGSVQIWDLRCKGFDAPVRAVKVPLDPSTNSSSAPKSNSKMIWARSVNTIYEAHQRTPAFSAPATGLKLPPSFDPPSKTEIPGRRGDVSITALQFLNPGQEHLLVTASEADAVVKLWDLRTTHNHRRGHATPLSSTRPTGAHTKHRHFGLTSLSLSGDGARLYTVCRDNTVYAYSISHLVLGYSPELSKTNSKPRRSGGPEKEGLGPIYGFRHPRLHASTFYVKSALRPAKDDKSELLAVGSSDGCALLFPTDERYMQKANDKRMLPSDPFGWNRPPLKGGGSSPSFTIRLEDSIPIYQHGSALIRGHSREVTGMSWTTKGELVSVGDDYNVRCWREGADARDLRMGGEKEGRRWGCGWAEADQIWDEDDG